MTPASGGAVLFLGRGGAIDGQQRQLFYLADEMARRGATPVVALSESGPLLSSLQAANVPCHIARMSAWRAPGRILQRMYDASRLVRIAQQNRIGLVHAHDVWRAEYARWIARRCRVPYIVHVRGPMSARDICKHRLMLADRVIAIALRYVDDLVAAGVDPARISLIDDAVDMTLFDPMKVDVGFLQREHSVSGKPVVGFVGRISPFKRAIEFLKMISLVPAEKRRDVQFVFVGEWENADYRKRVEQALAELDLLAFVKFIGRCDSKIMPHVLAGLDLLVTLSGGSVMFEAMALGVPVLTVRDEWRPMQHTRHGETAWCVNDPDLAVAAQALTQLIADTSERQRLGANAQAWVRSCLAVESMVTKTRAVYDSLRED